jgi:pimeloyl-ACP methyl ester carboxylesterase
VERELPHVDGVEHRWVEAGGYRFHIAEAGSGEPLVMLHGWPQHWYEWRDLIPPLARRYRVICLDLPGFGWSDVPVNRDDYLKENLAGGFAELFDALELGRVRLVGHDYGGLIAFLLCLRQPDRVDRHLALNILPPFARVTLAAAARMWRFWYQWAIASPLGARLVGSPRAFGKPIYDWVGTRSWKAAEREIFIGQFQEPARARATVLYYRNFVLREIGPIIGGRYRRMRLRTPTRLLFGTEDRPLPAALLRGCERYADDMTVELVPGVGHFIVDERPELVLDHALDFFD